MKRLLTLSVLLATVWLSSSCLAQLSTADRDYVEKVYYPATALLYSQTETGEMKMRCTATAIEKTVKGYTFVSASHCGCKESTESETSRAEKTFFFLTLDDSASKDFMSAKPEGCGYRHEGDDFMLFSVETTKEIPVVSLGEDPKMMAPIVNVASPLGLGKQTFFGTVSSRVLDRPVVVGDINWTNTVLLGIFGVDGGSSGSSVVCLDQRAICAFVVGSVDETTIVAMPVSRLIKLRKELAAGTYEYAPKKKNKD